MPSARDPLLVRLCLGIVRLCSAVVPSGSRADWRAEWEAEVRHRFDSIESEQNWSTRMDLLRRSLGAFPDAAWLRRQFTADADAIHDFRHAIRMLWKAPGFTMVAVFI